MAGAASAADDDRRAMNITNLMPTPAAARHLRVPAAWLRQEVESGRVPALRAGARLLVHVPTVERILLNRATMLGTKERSDAAS